MKLDFCVACGNKDALHHHHLVARADGGSDGDTNLITLCAECHGKIHGMKWRNNHVDLVRAGLARAKARGVRLGRPRVDADKETRIRELLAQGVGIVRVGKMVGCGTGVVQRIRAQVPNTV